MVVSLGRFHDGGQRLHVPVAVDVVLPVLRNQIFGARLVSAHVVALTVGGGFLEDVSDVERRKVRVGLKHQCNGACDARRGHAGPAEGHVAVAGVVLG